MRGDEALPADGDGPRTRMVPRHAAPRKSLFTKLQMPAGKAIAIAAMPTAVLMGMGITPHLALADEMPKNPYAPGPCVTQSDTPAPDATTAKPSATPSATESSAPSTKPSSSPSPSASTAEPKSALKALPKTLPTTAPKTAPTTAPTTPAAPKATPSPTKSYNPWDPLGVGDAIKDVLGLNKPAAPTTAPTTAPPTTAPTTAPPKAPSTSPAKAPAAKSSSPAAVAEKSAKAAAEAATKAADAAEKAAEKSATPTPSATPTTVDGKVPFPCPTHDAKALADAPYETEHGLLPDQPWYLESSVLTLKGLDYKGIVTVRTTNGTMKKVLKFTASSLDIKDLHQLVNGAGYVHHVQGPGTTSTIQNGTVTMYTEELKGNLFGLIPVTFSPDTPPPINVPLAVFTNVKIRQAGQFGGTLHISNLHQSITKGTYP
ncbi:hydrogenase expression protein HypF [Streptomyces sp. RKAG293]|uniref:hydrogenase expression protein HypF n=1 Tax=Streptomyces sp. RKAG293 TaxID=2893403 RepID=UPI00203427BA|nr:hydrogenase expression protein HypF [Streptomyces sp. RKAG293]MCM2421730.1 hydrogenase expression protein HypF [Streptomyces sp. RKAG293]